MQGLIKKIELEKSERSKVLLLNRISEKSQVGQMRKEPVMNLVTMPQRESQRTPSSVEKLAQLTERFADPRHSTLDESAVEMKVTAPSVQEASAVSSNELERLQSNLIKLEDLHLRMKFMMTEIEGLVRGRRLS